MARKVIGYEGEGRLRRPIYEDIGHARGRVGFGGDTLTESLPSRLLVGGHDGGGEPDGNSAIERRQATEAQRAAWAEERAEQQRQAAQPADVATPRPRPHLVSPPPPPAREPDPVTPPAVTPAEPVPRRIPVVAPVLPPPRSAGAALIAAPLPCPSCSHEPVCRIRPELVDVDLATTPGYELQPGVRIVATAIAVECEYFAPLRATDGREGVTSAPAPERSRAGTSGVPAARPAPVASSTKGRRHSTGADLERVAQVRAAVARHGGDGAPMARSKAAKELGMRPQALGRILQSAAGREARQADEATA